MTSFAAEPKVGLIYLTFATPDWERDINRCLASLEKLNYSREQVELICVESRSSVGRVKEWFERVWLPKSSVTLPRITYIFNDEVIGFAGNNNLGFEKAKELGCEYVYLLNEDTEVDPDFLRAAVRRVESDPSVAIVQSFILLGQDKTRVNTVGNALHFLGFGYSNGYRWTRERAEKFFADERRSNPDLEIGYASGAGELVRISAMETCGGLFDKKFFLYHEDTDASLRARLAGFKIVVEPRSVIFHHYDFSKSIKKYYWMERNRWAVILSFYKPWTLILIAPMLLTMEVAQFFFAIKGGWWREKIRVYREIVSSPFWNWMRSRIRLIHSIRTVSDHEFFRHTVSTIEFQGEAVANPLLTWVGNPLMRAYWFVVRLLIV